VFAAAGADDEDTEAFCHRGGGDWKRESGRGFVIAQIIDAIDGMRIRAPFPSLSFHSLPFPSSSCSE
jgi:hypothetical protein